MITSQTSTFLSEIESGAVIPTGKRAYFQERLRNRIFSLILREFLKNKEENGLTQKDVAKRISKGPEVINQWLSAPGNLTIDSISDLLLGISGSELNVSVDCLSEIPECQVETKTNIESNIGIIGIPLIPPTGAIPLPNANSYKGVSSTVPHRYQNHYAVTI